MPEPLGFLPRLISTPEDDYDNQGIEATGVFRGILTENMLETIRRCKKNYIDVYIEAMFFEDKPYPLTFVPEYFRTLPLYKDTEVIVRFYDNNYRYPYLYKLVKSLDTPLYQEDVELPESGELVEIPESKPTQIINQISPFLSIISADTLEEDNYTCYKQGDNFFFFTKDGITEVGSKRAFLYEELLLEVQTLKQQVKEFSLTASSKIDIELTSGSAISIKNSQASLGGLISDFLEILQDQVINGTPSTHTMSAATISKLSQLLVKWRNTFK